MDVHINQAITDGLRLRGVDVLTAQEDGSDRLPDPDLMDRAAALGRVLFSYDEDMLIEAARRQQEGIAFAGLIHEHFLDVHIGQCVHDLELIAQACDLEELANRVEYLPF
jgi:hypothetical protein